MAYVQEAAKGEGGGAPAALHYARRGLPLWLRWMPRVLLMLWLPVQVWSAYGTRSWSSDPGLYDFQANLATVLLVIAAAVLPAGSFVLAVLNRGANRRLALTGDWMADWSVRVAGIVMVVAGLYGAVCVAGMLELF